jgi:hypothetical protein
MMMARKFQISGRPIFRHRILKYFKVPVFEKQITLIAFNRKEKWNTEYGINVVSV